MYHEATQTDAALFRRLCPEIDGQRRFAPVMLKRLMKLGIEKTDPSELNQAEIKRFVRLDVDPDTVTWKR